VSSYEIILGIFLVPTEPDAEERSREEIDDQYNKVEGGEICFHFTALDL
jgi:hypothetical protein